MNLLKRAKQTWPGLSEQDLKTVLQTLTTYPTGDPDAILAALSDAYNKSDGNLLQAVNSADQELAKRQITPRL